MAYQIDPLNGDIVISGFNAGIAVSPYAGFTDMRNVNISSIPGEASVNFASVSSFAAPAVNGGAVTSASTVTNQLTMAGGLPAGLEQYQAIYFTASTIGGVTAGIQNVYWIGIITGNSFTLLNGTYGTASFSTVTITGNGTATFNTYNPNIFTQGANDLTGNYYILDKSGRVWSNHVLTLTTHSWTYAGNQTNVYSAGQGIGTYYASDGSAYLFVFSASTIDYLLINDSGRTPVNAAWAYQWNPAAGTVGSYQTTPTTPVLNTNFASLANHFVFNNQNNVFYIPDSNYVDQFFELAQSSGNPIIFDPTDNTTYEWNGPTPNSSAPVTIGYAVMLPTTETATCVGYLGSNILIGGIGNWIYVWDGTGNSNNSSVPDSVIPLAENWTYNIITVNTNAYCFVGNRGRIYITNGSQAQEFFKVPDHLQGLPEPYWTWGGGMYLKNKLFFGIQAHTAENAVNGHYTAGVWQIDLDSQAFSLSNSLSSSSPQGIASVIIPIVPSPYDTPSLNPYPAGFGFYVGWTSNGMSGFDSTVATPYTNGSTYIVSDFIPVGKYLNPVSPMQIEAKLSAPLAAGETIAVYTAQSINGTFTEWGTNQTEGSPTAMTSGLSAIFYAQSQQFQWLLIKIVLTSTSSNPSYCRMTQIRVSGATTKDMMPMAPYAVQ